MEYSKNQEQILRRLKTRGPQSVKILSNQLDMTTMGVRQHLADLGRKGVVKQTQEEKQTRGRPVRLWKLTKSGHENFTDSDSQITLELIEAVRSSLGEDSLDVIIEERHKPLLRKYKSEMDEAGQTLELRIKKLAELRNQEGYMAEVRLTPTGWLLIENHCPIRSIAECVSQNWKFSENCSEGVEKLRESTTFWRGPAVVLIELSKYMISSIELQIANY